MQDDPRYDDVVDDVKAFLRARWSTRSRAGIAEDARLARSGDRLRQDASTTTSRCSRRLDEIVALGRPVVVGTSRKCFIGRITGARDRATACRGRSPRTSSRSSAAPRCSASTTWRQARRGAGRCCCYVARPMDARRRHDDIDDDDVDEEPSRTRRRGRRRPRPPCHDRDQRPLALHAPRRERGRARGRPAPRARHPLEARRGDATVDRPRRGHRRLRRGLPARALVAQQRSYKTLERLCPAIADRLLDDFDAARGVGQGVQARAADPAAGRRGLRRGLARRPRSECRRARSTAPSRSRTEGAGRMACSSTRRGPRRRGLNGGYIAAIVLRRDDRGGRRPGAHAALAHPALPAPPQPAGRRRGGHRARRPHADAHERARWSRTGARPSSRSACSPATSRPPSSSPRRRRPLPAADDVPVLDWGTDVFPIATHVRLPAGDRPGPAARRSRAGGGHRRLAAAQGAARARRAAAGPVRRRLVARAVRPRGAARRRADDRPHDPLPRAPAAAAALDPAAPVMAASPRAPRRTASSRRTARCGRRTAPCSRPRANSRSRGSWHDHRLPRTRLQRRRPPRQLQAAVDALGGAGRRRPRVVVGLRDRAGRRGPRPAELPQRLPAHRDARSRPRRCWTPARRSSASSGRAQAGEGYVRHGPRPIDVDLLLLGDERRYASERLTLPHPEVLARGASCSSRCSSWTSTLQTAGRHALRDALAALPDRGRACAVRARRWTVGAEAPDAARRRRRQHPDALRRVTTASALRRALALRDRARVDRRRARRGAAQPARAARLRLRRPRRRRSSPRPCPQLEPEWTAMAERYLGHEMLVVGPGTEDRACRSATTTRARSAPTGSSTRSRSASASAGRRCASTSARRSTFDVVSRRRRVPRRR